MRRRAIVFSSAVIALAFAAAGIAAVLAADHRRVGGTNSRIPPSALRPPVTRSFVAVADAYASAAKPFNHYGQARILRVSGVPEIRSYLRFRVRGLRGRVMRAVLLVYAQTRSGRNYSVRGVASRRRWRERTITYANAPPVSPQAADVSYRAGGWQLFDVTSLVHGDGTLDLALTKSSPGQLALASSESRGRSPQLIVEMGASSAASPGDPVLVAAGNIASCSSRDDETTASLVETLPGTVAVLGDAVDGAADAGEFADCYGPSWGRVRARTRPALGDGEYDAAGYFSYFGDAVRPRGRGYYSYDLGTWHIVVLDSNCARVGGCGVGSREERWLQADLVAHPRACTLAYWHHPRFSSGRSGNHPELQAFWRDLVQAEVDVVLSAHDEDYERFAPQTATREADPKRGMREFVVGTGGQGLGGWGAISRNSEVRSNTALGVLKLTLHGHGYSWQFLSEPGNAFSDSGLTSCH